MTIARAPRILFLSPGLVALISNILAKNTTNNDVNIHRCSVALINAIALIMNPPCHRNVRQFKVVRLLA